MGELSNKAIIDMLRPEYQPRHQPTPHDYAVEFLNDFAGCYAVDAASLRTLQSAIHAASSSDPSARTAHINSAVAYFSAVLERNSAIQPAEREQRIERLHRSLNDLAAPHELPALSIGSHIEVQHQRRHGHAAQHEAPMAAYREAKAFLVQFADTYAQEPHDHELLQGAISIASRGRSPVGQEARDVARHDILRHFEGKVRHHELKLAAEQGEGLPDAAARAQLISQATDKAEAVNLELGRSLRALQHGLSRDHGAAASR